ncbi:glycosyltransferase [Rhizobium oryziradicis]|uniref:Glycosyltransferase n=1 Tax=Rhizobium oryziradicis TaxID=1867956 RepID=A0A1Q8ZLD2_9HYPH|nr:glycosyltransferase [Rhizobium oryziradicis]OLP42701.1 hypothetical protein BJF95_00785 [Rhizobium oryziradicis]
MKLISDKIRYISSRIKRENVFEKRYTSLFDSKYYYSAYPDVRRSGVDAWNHYSSVGWKEGRNPSSKINTVAYIVEYPSIIDLDINPVMHSVDVGNKHVEAVHSNYPSTEKIKNILEKENLPESLRVFISSYYLIKNSENFDKNYYAGKMGASILDPVEHYIRYGGLGMISPHADFDPVFYYEAYPDVRRAAIDPLLHYLRHGQHEGRQRNSAEFANENGRTGNGSRFRAAQIEQKIHNTCADIRERLERAPRSAPNVSGPLISILTPVYNVDAHLLREMVQSVLRQNYTNWQLCLVDDASTNTELRDVLGEIASLDSRIDVAFRPANGGISAATNDCLTMARGEYVALVDNDDLITSDALAEMVKAINENNFPDWLYSDECKIDVDNNVSDLFAKPDWSPLLLVNYMYTGHLTLYRRSLVNKLGGFRSEYDFSQDYDLALRMSECAKNIVHVEKYLYCWRMIPTSGSMGGKPTARISNIAALKDAADRQSLNGEVSALPTANRLKITVSNDKVSIIIPSDNKENIRQSIDSIISLSTYKNYEIVVVTNSVIVDDLNVFYSNENLIWKRYDKPFNFSDKCNAGTQASSGKYVIFFNDDVRVITPDWIEAILECFSFPNVGAVGPKLLYEDGSIQHAGMVTGVRRFVGTAFHTYPSDTGAHFNFAQCLREVSLICGALLAIPREIFDNVGGYDAINTPINHSDVDLCFKIREAGFTCVYTPYASLFHIGHVSIGAEEQLSSQKKIEKKKEKIDTYLIHRWGNYIARDPYFPQSIRDLTFIDSQEPFDFYPPQPQASGDRDVLIISHDLSGSGAPKLVYDLAIMLRRSGCRVVVASPADGHYRHHLSNEGFAVIVDPLIAIAHEASMVVLGGFDVVIANTIVCWKAASELSKSADVYLYAHETELVRHFVSHNEEFVKALSGIKGVWCGSEQSARYLREAGIVPEIIEYGVDDLAIMPRSPRISICLFGSIEPRKAQDLAVLGFAEIADDIRDKAKLDIYGRTLDKNYKSEIDRIVTSFDNVRLHGELDYKGYLEELERCDIVLVCSRDDTLPLVSLDALALGKPLVCSRTTGTSTYLVHKESGIVLEENSPHEIGQALQSLIDSSDLREEIGRGGRLVFEKHFTRSAFSRRLSEQLQFSVN